MGADRPHWAEAAPDPTTYKAPPGRPRAVAVAEQDEAAGGREKRRVHLGHGGTALASIELKFLGGRRIYAYVRYMKDGRTVSCYVGEAEGKTREERLQAAWRQATKAGLFKGRN